MTERVIIPAAEDLPRFHRKGPRAAPGEEPFLSYAPDEDLVPPIAHAGEGYKVHMTGLTHDERGYPAIDATTHDQLINRLVCHRRNHFSADHVNYFTSDTSRCTRRSAVTTPTRS